MIRVLRGPNVWARVPVLEVNAGDGERIAPAVLQLQKDVGCRVSFCDARHSAFAVEYEDEEVARRALAVVLGEGGSAAELREYADDVLMGANTRALYDAARRRGIPVRRLDSGTLLQLGHGVKQRRLSGAFTDRTASIGESIGWDKPLAKKILAAIGVAVPEGRRVADADDAWRLAQELGGTVVVKPESANHGRSVYIGVSSREEIAAAFAAASSEAENPAVIVERFVSGAEHRVLVVNGEVAGATRGDPLYVAGDGRRTVAELVDKVNLDPRRGPGAECPLFPVSFDEMTVATLARQGYASSSVVPEGARVLVQRNGNLSTDVTALVHPENRALVALAARAVGLDVAGVDLVVNDISRPLAEQGGAILEVNAMPGLMMHLRPGSGEAQPVDDIIVGSLFPAGDDGRIPIVAVVSDASLCLAIGERLQAAGLFTGVECSEGTFVGGRASRASDVLMHPLLEAAVIEVSYERIRERGLTFDRCAAVVMDAASACCDAARVLVECGGVIIPAGAPDCVERAAAVGLSKDESSLLRPNSPSSRLV